MTERELQEITRRVSELMLGTIQMLDDDYLLRVSEVAKLLRCPEQEVWTLVHRRKIESLIVGRHSRRVPLRAVRKVIDQGLIPTRTLDVGSVQKDA